MSVVNHSAYQSWFKEFYGAQGEVLENVKTPLLSVLDKTKSADWVGDQFIAPFRMDVAVGLGYRSQGQNLPSPGAALRARGVFDAAKVYGLASYEREVIKQSRNDRGSFAKATVDEAQSVVEGFRLHMLERAFFGDGTGILAQIDDASITGAGTTASPWLFDLDAVGAASPKGNQRYFAQNQKVDLYTVGGVYQLTIQIVSATRNSSTGVVSIAATSVALGNASSPTDNDLLYWEGNKGLECVGLANIASSVAGTLYGLSQTTYPKMRGLVSDLAGAALAYDDVNDFVSQLEEESMSPTLAITSPAALAMLKNQSEELKRYAPAEARAKGSPTIGFKGIEIMTEEGPIPLIASKMCPRDELFLINDKKMKLVLREDFGWFDDDGTVLLRKEGKDQYEARFGGYFQLFCAAPNSVGRLKGFAV